MEQPVRFGKQVALKFLGRGEFSSQRQRLSSPDNPRSIKKAT
ncbi:hypothetical protein CJA_3475 [Cellvibrio japonicus Ueda107]|uniref:Uncharacterized protein n=1 Tax=Cellvibrio japonicus (strain Ueda107) TaxID=498211 RepID=B3PG21_CELJU|nr:hypothetical protein CJA_3475 [Cellvibrio japonicus Ueda107]